MQAAGNVRVQVQVQVQMQVQVHVPGKHFPQLTPAEPKDSFWGTKLRRIVKLHYE